MAAVILPPSISRRASMVPAQAQPRAKAICRSSSTATASTWSEASAAAPRRRHVSVDDYLIAHSEHRMHEMAAMRRIDAGARDQGDAPGLMAAKLDLAAGRRAGDDRRGGEEGA